MLSLTLFYRKGLPFLNEHGLFVISIYTNYFTLSTGNDSFIYNDQFNHSTWLTFIKNRLEIALELLSGDGSLWINIDDDEAHYLKVLCDSILGRENFLANIIWKKK